MVKKSHLTDFLVRVSFEAFVKKAFQHQRNEKLGNQPYIAHICFVISRFIEGDINRLLINLPPQHLKSFVGSICLAAYLLGKELDGYALCWSRIATALPKTFATKFGI